MARGHKCGELLLTTQTTQRNWSSQTIPNFKIKYLKVNRMRILTGSVYLGEDFEVPPKCNPAESETLDSGTGTLA